MDYFVVDTNFFITGFQSRPQSFRKFAKILKQLNIKIAITPDIKNEMRHFLLREVIPHISVNRVDKNEFDRFLTDLYEITTSVPQKPDLTVVFMGKKMSATIVSSDIKLIETAEIINIKTLTNSAFMRYIAENNTAPENTSFIKELQSKLFSEEIRHSVSSTNRYDPVKRISKIVKSAISVIRSEYEEKLSTQEIGDLRDGGKFSIQSMQLRELLAEIKTDLRILENDFAEEKYEQLEEELLSRVREITDYIIDWKLAIDNIEDHPIYNEALVTLGRLQYLACICLIENKKIELARVYMDKMMMVLFQNSKAVEEYGMDVHLLRMILLLLSEQIQRLPSYFTPAFEDECIKRNRNDIANIIHPLILLSVVLGVEGVEETATTHSYEDIEFINQLGFKFMQLGKLDEAIRMFEQTFFLSLNSKNHGLCILSLEFLSWLFFAGKEGVKEKISRLYAILVEKSPKIKISYQVKLNLTRSQKALAKYVATSYQNLTKLPIELKSPLYCIGSETVKIQGLGFTPIIRVMNWDAMTRIGIVDENHAMINKATLGSTIYPIDGKIKVVQASTHIRKKYNVELLMYIDSKSSPTMIIRSPGGGWELPLQVQKAEEKIND